VEEGDTMSIFIVRVKDGAEALPFSGIEMRVSWRGQLSERMQTDALPSCIRTVSDDVGVRGRSTIKPWREYYEVCMFLRRSC
jgi:hypothetical protein